MRGYCRVRYGIVSDIHANLAAFHAVLVDMGKVDEIWCLGDLVGYGPDPNECVELLRRYPHRCLVGNHDLAALGRLDTSDFNPAASEAAAWTARAISERTRLFLESLPMKLVVEPFTLVHGSPRHPIWEYLINPARAEANFGLFDTPACLVGHSHMPALYVQESPGAILSTVPGPGDRIEVGPQKLIANPGGVGQPRDGDPRAAYALYDSESRMLEWRRVAYPIDVTQKRMRAWGLPLRLVERLSHGW